MSEGKPRVYVTSGSFGTSGPDIFKRLNCLAEVTVRRGKHSVQQLKKVVAEYDGIVLGTDPVTREVLSGEVKVRIIARHGVGLDNIDLEAATERGIVVTYTPGVNADSVAEHTIGLLLSLTKRIAEAHRLMRDGGWDRACFIGHEIKGKTLGIIGLGRIGSEVAVRAKAFGMRVVAYDPYVDKSRAEELKVPLVSLGELLETSDVVTIHAALTRETRHMIGEKELRRMKPTAYIVNTARGALIDEKALVKALKEKWIAGAALDVYEEEPLPEDHPLRKMDNVVLTPHIASYTCEAIRRTDEMVLESLETFFKGGKPRWVANPEVWARIRMGEFNAP